MLMIMATSIAVLLLASIGYIVADYYNSRDDLRRQLTAQADVIRKNSTAALEFLDQDDAQETLRTVAPNEHIRSACLYDAAGKLFSAYVSSAASTPCPADPGPDGHRFLSDRLLIVSPIDLRGQRRGTLLLRSDLELLRARMRGQFLIVGILLLVTSGVALLMSLRLHSIVSAPLNALARVATAVSSHGDYSLRAARTTDDEVGVLVDAFNRMLERIQLRERELSAANEDLRNEIVERRRAEQERAQLLVREREANRLKDEFLATLSHELRTPLNAILGWTKLLRSSAVPPAGIDRALEKIERNAQAQTRLVEDLLEVSRITTGKLRLDIKNVDLITVASTAIESIRPTAEARGVAIDRHFAAPSLPTTGDPDRLQQVLWNLISNAVKFTPPGGTVGVHLRRDGTADEMSVSDTGIGIDPAFLPDVFDTFRQADATTTRMYGGLGLGLSIVRHIVELHGGEVRAESDGAGKGSRFIGTPANRRPRTTAADARRRDQSRTAHDSAYRSRHRGRGRRSGHARHPAVGARTSGCIGAGCGECRRGGADVRRTSARRADQRYCDAGAGRVRAPAAAPGDARHRHAARDRCAHGIRGSQRPAPRRRRRVRSPHGQAVRCGPSRPGAARSLLAIANH